MAVTKETKVVISADASKYTRAMRSMKLTAKKTGSAVGAVFKKLGSIMTGMVGKVAALAGIGGLGLLAKRALETGDIIHKMSIRLGISTEALSELELVAKLSGVSFQTTAKAYQKMSENISDANTGLGTAKDSIADLGLDVAKLHALSPEKQFEAIADALQGITNQSDKIRVAADIFGGRGVEVLQIMDKGAAGIREMREQAELLGITLSQDAANRIAAVNDAIARFTGAIGAASKAIVADLGPSLTKLINTFAFKVPAAMKTTVDWLDRIINRIIEIKGFDFEALQRAQGAVPDVQLGRAGLIPAGTLGAGTPIGGDETAADAERKAAELERLQLHHETIEQLRMNHGINMAEAARSEAEFRARSAEDLAKMEIHWAKTSAAAAEKAAKLKISASKMTLDNIIKTGKLMLQESSTRNKEIFRIVQAASIGKAIMGTYTGAAQALAEVPYPYNFAAAASVIAFGLAQVSQIASQSFDSGSTTGVSGGGAAGVPAVSPTTAPVVSTVGTSALLAETAEKRGTLNFFFEGDIIGDDQFIDDMVERINAAEDRDVFINKTVFATELE